jgi:excisionase family DNA binding protein
VDYTNKSELFENQIVGVKEAANILGLSTKTVYKLAREGTLPHGKAGSKYRFHRSELVKFTKGG